MSKKFDAWEEDNRIARERAELLEERRHMPLTRAMMIDAIENVARQYSTNGNHDSDLIADAFRALAEELK